MLKYVWEWVTCYFCVDGTLWYCKQFGTGKPPSHELFTIPKTQTSIKFLKMLHIDNTYV